METPGGALAVFRAGSLRGLGRLDPLFQGPAAVLESLRAARADGLEVHDATAAGVSFAPGSAELARDRAAVAALEGAERAVAQDDVEGALAALTEALRLKPDYPEALRQSGRLLRRLGCAREAIRSFECLVQVSPADAAAHREAGETLLEAGLPVEAEKCFLRARRLNHWDPAIHRGMAYARFDRKLFRDALTWMRGALRLDPANVEIAVDCAAILQAAGRPRDALAFLRSYQSLHPHPELDTLVRSLEQDPAGAAPVEGGSGPKRGLHVLLPTPS
jgi:tetratricopeptide (TPR) repeat protein